jgi:RNA polymerase sigma factor (sigma-70 family)
MMGIKQETDQDLILACRQGDEKAWERLLDNYERLVYSIPLNYGLSVEDAADVTQTTFMILMQSLDRLYPETRLAPWLATVARRHTWRFLERRRREKVDPEEDIGENERLVEENGSRISEVEKWERIEWLNQGLNRLTQRCRELLLALYFDVDEPSYAEISKRFHMPVGSIGPTRARCLEHLKQHLGVLVPD